MSLPDGSTAMVDVGIPTYRRIEFVAAAIDLVDRT